MTKTWRVFFLCCFILVSIIAFAKDTKSVIVPEITNIKLIAKTMEVGHYRGKQFKRTIKIAVFDKGFSAYKSLLGKSLPASTVLHSPEGQDDGSYHGTQMAVLISKLMQLSGAKTDYELHLYVARGFNELAPAVDKAIDDKVDILLYSQVWQYGGNSDGNGFINMVIDKAVHAGILWINAAGDLGSYTRFVPIVDNGSGYVKFGKKNEPGAKIICHPTKDGKTCDTRIEMTWNDAKDDPNAGTDKDLDAYLVDAKGNVIEKSEKKQVLGNPPGQGYTHDPREEIIHVLKAGTYYLRAKFVSHNFADDDRMRITVEPQGAQNGTLELDQPTMDENLLPPADNPNVIVIGASDSPLTTNRSKSRGLPLISFPGRVDFQFGEPLYGDSQSAALAAAITALEIGTGNTNPDQESVTDVLKSLSDKLAAQHQGSSGGGGNVAQNDHAPINRNRPRGDRGNPNEYPPSGRAPMNCLVSIPLPPDQVYPELRALLDSGRASMIALHGQLVVAYQGNFARETGIYPLTPSSRVFMQPGLPGYSPGGAISIDLSLLTEGLPRGAYEIVNTPLPPCE